MNAISSATTARPDANVLANFQYSKLSRASIDVQSSAGISLITADGDKVTLSTSTSLHASLQTYDFLGRTGGQTVAAQGQEFQLSTSSGFALSVEGSLDEEELKDIKKLLNTLSAIGNGLVNGNPDNGLQRIAQLNNLDSIASFEANFSYSKQITAVTASQLSTTSAPQAQENPAASTVAPSPSTATPDSFLAQLTQAAKRLDGDDSLEKIPKRFVQLLKKLAHQLPLDEAEEKLTKKIAAEHTKHHHRHHAEAPAELAA